MELTLNKSTALSALIVALFAASLGAQAASETAQVNITASVANNTCTADWDASGVNVEMGKSSLRDFSQKGDVALTKVFELKLEDCGDGASQVKVTATGASDASDSNAFANTLAGGASGVAITIFGDETQSTQMLPDGSNSVKYNIANQEATLKFAAKLEKSGSDDVTVGDVKTTVNMTIDYE